MAEHTGVLIRDEDLYATGSGNDGGVFGKGLLGNVCEDAAAAWEDSFCMEWKETLGALFTQCDL